MLKESKRKVEAILSIVVVLLMLLSFIEPLNDSVGLIIAIIVGLITLIVMDLDSDEPRGSWITWTFNMCIWVVILLMELDIVNF